MEPERGVNPYTLAERLLADVRLTPGQLAQLRAISAKYYTSLASIDQGASGAMPGAAELVSRIAADVRQMLTDEQRIVFDRNLPQVIPSSLAPPE